MEVTIIEMSQGEYQMLGHTSIQARGVWGQINLKTHTNEQYSAKHSLLSAESKTYHNTGGIWTKIDDPGADLSIQLWAIESLPKNEKKGLSNCWTQ
jgi:hypothetical protein